MTAFIKRSLQKNTDRGRRRIGIALCVLGILLNLLLFLLKTAGGRLSGSVAVTADGFNNLADTCSCLLTLLGFLLSGKKPDQRYPMGYGRLEYLCGLLIAAAILMIGGKMLLSSVFQLLHPEPVDGSLTVIVFLLLSILVKSFMYLYNRKCGSILRSPAMRAAALDSLSDCCATFAILLSILLEKLTGLHADGAVGVPVALCILYAGVTSLKESAAPLLGKGIDKELAERLGSITQGYRTERIILHDYGPSKKLLTLYIRSEISAEELIGIRERIMRELQIEAVICPCDEPQNTE